MTIKTEGTHTAEFLLSEGAGKISREVVTLAATATALPAGTVLAVVTASGHYAPYDGEDTTTGIGTAVGILYSAVRASDTTQPGVAVVRLAEASAALLAGLDTAGAADLKARNIIVR